MSGKEESNGEIEGSGSEIGEKGRDESSTFHTEPFTLLLHILQNDEHPVPSTLFMAVNMAELVQEVTGTIPVSVEVVTDREAVVSLDKTVPAVGVVRQLHGSLVWGPHHTKVTCLLSSKESIMKIVQDREVARHRLEELETEHRDAVLDCEWQTDQFEDMLKKFGEEVRRIEELEKKVSQHQSKSHPESISAAAVLECPESKLIQPQDVII